MRMESAFVDFDISAAESGDFSTRSLKIPSSTAILMVEVSRS